MQLDGELAVVQARAVGLGQRVLANEGWIAGGFLVDGAADPQRYVALAEQQRALQRRRFALTPRLLTDAALGPIA